MDYIRRWHWRYSTTERIRLPNETIQNEYLFICFSNIFKWFGCCTRVWI